MESVRRLTTLGIEELAHVLFYLRGKRILVLYLTGDSALRWKMANGAVREIRLSRYSVLKYVPIPNCIPEFKQLRTFSILKLGRLHDDSASIRRILKRLPPTLETLELNLWEGENSLLEDSFSGLNELFEQDYSHDNDVNPPRVPENRLWSLQEHFPRLKTLQFFETKPVLVNSDVQFLPKSLTDLQLSNRTKITSEGWKDLPEGLISFTPGDSEGCPDKSHLALPLRFLNLNRIFWDSSDRMVECLPRTMESVGFLSLPKFELLPPTLLSLSVYCSRMDIKWDALPVLTKLHFIAPYEEAITSNFICQLPRTLCSLTLEGGIVSPDNESTMIFPPNLTSLSIDAVRNVNSKFLRALPQTLELLSLSSCELSEVMDWCSYLPRALRQLSVGDIDGEFTLSNLPPFLRSCTVISRTVTRSSRLSVPLETRFSQSCILLSLELTVQKINEKFCFLPSTLTHLSLPFCTSFHPSSFSLLPRALKRFQLPSNYVLATAADLANLPRTLKVLVLSQTPLSIEQDQRIEDNSNQMVENDEIQRITACIKALPPKLKQFSQELILPFSVKSSSCGQRELLLSLPRTLKHLHTPDWHLDARLVCALPPLLQSLDAIFYDEPERSSLETSQFLAENGPKNLEPFDCRWFVSHPQNHAIVAFTRHAKTAFDKRFFEKKLQQKDGFWASNWMKP